MFSFSIHSNKSRSQVLPLFKGIGFQWDSVTHVRPFFQEEDERRLWTLLGWCPRSVWALCTQVTDWLTCFSAAVIWELISPKPVEKHTASLNAKSSKIGIPGKGPRVNHCRTRAICNSWWWGLRINKLRREHSALKNPIRAWSSLWYWIGPSTFLGPNLAHLSLVSCLCIKNPNLMKTNEAAADVDDVLSCLRTRVLAQPTLPSSQWPWTGS